MCVDLGDAPELIPLFDNSDPDCNNSKDNVAGVDITGYGGVL
jgi:hypothetical protein